MARRATIQRKILRKFFAPTSIIRAQKNNFADCLQIQTDDIVLEFQRLRTQHNFQREGMSQNTDSAQNIAVFHHLARCYPDSLDR